VVTAAHPPLPPARLSIMLGKVMTAPSEPQVLRETSAMKDVRRALSMTGFIAVISIAAHAQNSSP